MMLARVTSVSFCKSCRKPRIRKPRVAKVLRLMSYMIESSLFELSHGPRVNSRELILRLSETTRGFLMVTETPSPMARGACSIRLRGLTDDLADGQTNTVVQRSSNELNAIEVERSSKVAN